MALSEWATRKQHIDRALTQAGWIPIIHYDTHTLRNLVVFEEHPTASGPADYVLFYNDTPLAIVEAKKLGVGPQNVLKQAQRYARDFTDSPFDFDGYHVPFIGPDTRYVTPEKADGVKWRLSPFLPEKMYFVYVINSPLIRGQIIRITQGVAQQKISLKRFKTVAIPLAPFAEQRRIVARIEALFAQADILEAQVAATRRRLEQVDQAILARAFRGELVEQDPRNEPASVLLERIQRMREGVVND